LKNRGRKKALRRGVKEKRKLQKSSFLIILSFRNFLPVCQRIVKISFEVNKNIPCPAELKGGPLDGLITNCPFDVYKVPVKSFLKDPSTKESGQYVKLHHYKRISLDVFRYLGVY
jgi:hypothetical protein